MSNETMLELLAQKKELEYRMDEMNDTLEGCDWCCGGGDEEMSELNADLARVDALLAFKNPGEK